jgi:hypothetical protein
MNDEEWKDLRNGKIEEKLLEYYHSNTLALELELTSIRWLRILRATVVFNLKGNNDCNSIINIIDLEIKNKEDLKAIRQWTIETIKNDINDVAIWDIRSRKYWKTEKVLASIGNWLKDEGTLEELYDHLITKDMRLAVRPDFFPEPTQLDKEIDKIIDDDDLELHKKMLKWEDKQKADNKKYCLKCWMEDEAETDISDRRNASFCEKHQAEYRKKYLEQKKKELPSSARANKKYYDFAKVCEGSSPDEIKALIDKRNREQERQQIEYGKIRELMKNGKPFNSNEKKAIEEKIRELRTEIKIASQIRIKKMRERGADI